MGIEEFPLGSVIVVREIISMYHQNVQEQSQSKGKKG